MELETIIFPTDFSHTGDGALGLAKSLARDAGARLLVVHVEEPPAAYGGEMYYGTAEPDVEKLNVMLDDIVSPAGDIEIEHRLIVGDPATALVGLAEEENADLIVMGTHGRTGLMRLLMGSVAEVVVRRAPCPVLTYRQPTNE